MEQKLCLFIMLLAIISNLDLVKGCGLNHQKVDPPIQLQQPIQSRLLQQNNPVHPIRIVGDFILSGQIPQIQTLIATVFNISAFYYSKIITTTSPTFSILPQASVRACSVTLQQVPAKYLVQGFNRSTTDLLIFIKLMTSLESGYYVALATACVSVRRPIYGYMNININQFQLQARSNFQVALQVVIHETAHVLGFGKVYFSNFYRSPTSSQVLPLSSVLRNISGRTYVITPNVMNFIQKYFNCNDSITGALLEDEGTSSTALNHWQRKVFYNQIMTASVNDFGMKFSGLTLALLKDTNYYSNIDMSYAEIIRWGYKRGCNFARGLINSPPQFCDPAVSTSQQCDFYSQSVSLCSSLDRNMNNAYYFEYYNNGPCSIQQPTNNGSIEQFFSYKKGLGSKCFFISLQVNNVFNILTASACYQSSCLQNGSIRVIVGNQTDNCLYPGQQLKFRTVKVSCPNDFIVFCSSKSCPKHCNQRGLCLKGQCICLPPYRGDSCQIRCQKYFHDATKTCVQSCSNIEYIMLPNICVNACPVNYIVGDNRVCQYCNETCRNALKRVRV